MALSAAGLAAPSAAFAADSGDTGTVVNGDTGESWGPIDAAGQARLAELVAEDTGVGGVSTMSTTPCANSAPIGAATTSPTEVEAGTAVTPLSTCVHTIPATKTLSVKWQQQKKGYWCGPTTVSMASYYFGTKKTQAQVASYIGTTKAGSDRLQVAKGMKWASGSRKIGYTQIAAPNASKITSILRADIGKNVAPVAVNTHEIAGGSHYNKHPNRTIGHFILAYGYTSGGQTAKIADPAAGLSGGYASAAEKFSISASTLAGFVDDRGVVA
ncbi:hypothetical protein GCM10023221_16150 [Luteimicrobium xylanilyticum]|uniref:Peptidase C39-like domain-containing protein n=1 Tax=Luteimicrobium xylanilyticum TaxID=1133546 RepID=A0A5P9QF41_9MICO|nr:C39 family peptidase [Luteimicrobium xylanilyticum]QFV00018.1 hypothetical protein KDY119_03553 [Luteimicrobium xylanilyticum]